MNKSIIFSVIAVLVIILGAVYFLNQPISRQNNAPAGTSGYEGNAPVSNQGAPVTGGGTAGIAQGKRYEIHMQNNQFVPSELSIKVGDTVVFINDDSVEHWPASGMHPTHLLCLGFDSLKGMKQGETYEHTFSSLQNNGTCPMHDHMMPKMFGKITVTQ